MVLILGNSCEVIPLETNSLMSFLRRRPPLSCLQPRTVSYIVSEFLGNNFLLCMWYSHLDFYLETLYPVPYFSFFSIAQEPHFSQYICCHFPISCKFKCIADSHLLLNLTVHNISFVVFKHDYSLFCTPCIFLSKYLALAESVEGHAVSIVNLSECQKYMYL